MAATPERVGILGGTFDPVHLGHLIIAEEIREKMNLDRVVFIPSGKPPHKTALCISNAEHRLAMVQKAVEGNPFFEASDMEIKRPGYTYTVDTLQQLKDYYGESVRLYFIIGADVVHDLMTWKDYRKVFTLCEFIAVMRPGFEREAFDRTVELLAEQFRAVIHPAEVPQIGISSTAIRERCRGGKSVKYLVPEKIEEYIRENGLYRQEAEV